MNEVRFVDLFAGIGGIRIGFEEAFKEAGFTTKCVMTSEIKPHALKALHQNFNHDYIVGDITKVSNDNIPDFDFLLAGFPCQPFSAAGNRLGFVDTRGTLFFEVERILEDKKPWGFILENVEGLVKHDLENKKDEIGRTLKTILQRLKKLGYTNTRWEVLNAQNFGVPQNRKRIFIVGSLSGEINLKGFERKSKKIKDILQKGLPRLENRLTSLLLNHFRIEELHGKSIKDKRGGDNNIHSWDIELKGPVSKLQAELLNQLFKERRKKKWAVEHGIKWMDGMPLTLSQIKTFFDVPNLKRLLDDLVKKGYLKYEHPKKEIVESTTLGVKRYRLEDTNLEKGYNIVAGKLSFDVNKILDPNDVAPTLVATDMVKLVVPDSGGLRRMTVREGLRLLGFPEWVSLNVPENDAYDLMGNSVAVPVVKEIALRLSAEYINNYSTVKVSPVCSL